MCLTYKIINKAIFISIDATTITFPMILSFFYKSLEVKCMNRMMNNIIYEVNKNRQIIKDGQMLTKKFCTIIQFLRHFYL